MQTVVGFEYVQTDHIWVAHLVATFVQTPHKWGGPGEREAIYRLHATICVETKGKNK